MTPLPRLSRPCALLATGLLSASLLSACQPASERQDELAAAPPPQPAAAPPPPTAAQAQAAREAMQAQFVDDALGVAILPTPGFTLRRDFHRDYLAADAWKAFADADTEGVPVVALVLDGSDDVTAAELRLGSSDDPNAVASCLEVSDSAQPRRSDEVRLDGQPFRHFRASDAAMSHYLSVDAYRAVRHGRCFAIDLLIAGTRPEVYDPPRTPPFDQDQARARLQEALAAIRFIR